MLFEIYLSEDAVAYIFVLNGNKIKAANLYETLVPNYTALVVTRL